MTKLLALILSLSPIAALANSCPDVYDCKSASGRYQISLAHCDDNSLGNHPGVDPDSDHGYLLLIDGKKVTDAGLSNTWDGDKFVAFEFTLPMLGDKEQILSAELDKKTLRGVIAYKTREFEPGSFKTVKAEAIRCKDD